MLCFSMGRRNFLKKTFLRISYLVGAIFLAYPVFSFITFKKNRKKIITFLAKEQLSIATFREGVYLIKNKNETYALSARCTHLGCTLNYDEISNNFRCPCHGSVFDLSGKIVSGPARKNISRIPIDRKANGDIMVTLRL